MKQLRSVFYWIFVLLVALLGGHAVLSFWNKPVLPLLIAAGTLLTIMASLRGRKSRNAQEPLLKSRVFGGRIGGLVGLVAEAVFLYATHVIYYGLLLVYIFPALGFVFYPFGYWLGYGFVWLAQDPRKSTA